MTAIGGRALGDVLRRHPYHVALAALAVGLACAPAPDEVGLAVAGSASLVLACVGLPAQAGLAVVLVLAGSLAGEARLRAVEPVLEGRLVGAQIERRAILLEHPRPGRFGSSAAVQIASAESGPRLLAEASRSERWPAGAGPGTRRHASWRCCFARDANRARSRRPCWWLASPTACSAGKASESTQGS